MEEILQKILGRFDSIDVRFDAIDYRFDRMEKPLDSMDNRLDSVENRLDSMDNRLLDVEEGQKSLLSEQGEMRKEVAFYYGSLMKKLDEAKIELSSELKHVSHIQKQHQDVLEILNERQQ
ncbi:hypothetical protein AABM38_22745 [Heyndrickxia sp. MSNUG]|uniref:hypothetical protein n=1 Tax=Heyndrickxia sp. MSNUG TaxID=3136677 RepID=UPI003C2F457B